MGKTNKERSKELKTIHIIIKHFKITIMKNVIKYTTDGKKVLVVGKLNAQETIVQEIFISNEVEVPSGENFVVKSLHDTPVVSWKENELKKLELRFDEEQRRWNNDISKMKNKLRDTYIELEKRLEYTGKALKTYLLNLLRILLIFLLNKIQWIVTTEHTPRIYNWEVYLKLYDDKLRLLSFFGKDDGTLTYAMNHYYDYSGGNYYFVPFENYEDALQYFKDLIIKNGIGDTSIKIAKEYGIEFPKEELIKYYTDRKNNYIKNIEHSDKESNKFTNLLNETNEILQSLGM